MNTNVVESFLDLAPQITLQYATASVTLTIYDQSQDSPGDTFTREEKIAYYQGRYVTADGWCRCLSCSLENPDYESSLGHITLSFAHWRVQDALEEIRRLLD